MTGRDLIKYIMNNYMEDYTIVFRGCEIFEEEQNYRVWLDVKRNQIRKGSNIIIFEHPDIKRINKIGKKLPRNKSDIILHEINPNLFEVSVKGVKK